nr:unnamed protein product [Callosobruchus analis]
MDFFALLVIVLKASQALSHCSDDWPDCDKGKNTVCLREEDCSAVDECEAGPMTYNIRKKLVDLHNQLRNSMAGGDPDLPSVQAANMMIVSYDSGLQPRSGDQKLGFAEPEKFVENGVQSWYDEIKLASPSEVDLYQFKSSTGHWTQLIWADTTHVGCGQSGQKKGSEGYLACNYGPAGNVMNKKVLEKGEPATKCPAGQTRNPQYSNLCGVEDTSMLSIDSAGTKIESGNFGIIFLTVLVYTLIKIVLIHGIISSSGTSCSISGRAEGDDTYLACNYGPSGNIAGASVVKRGKPCTKCPKGTGCNTVYPHLCGIEDITDLSAATRLSYSIEETLASVLVNFAFYKKVLERGEPCSRCPLGVFCNQEYENLCGEIEGIEGLSGGKETVNRPAVGLVVILLKCALYMVFA